MARNRSMAKSAMVPLLGDWRTGRKMVGAFRNALMSMTIAMATVGALPGLGGGQALSPGQERTLRPKDTFTDCDVCPEMVVVPAGSFIMGSPATEKNRNANEGPR